MSNTPPAVKDFDQAAFFLQYPPPDIPDVDLELVCPTVAGDYYLELVDGKWLEQSGGQLHGLGLRAISRQRKAVFTENPCFRCGHCRISCHFGKTPATCSPCKRPVPAKAVEADQDDMQPCPFCGSPADPEKLRETRLSAKDICVWLFAAKFKDVAKPSTTKTPGA